MNTSRRQERGMYLLSHWWNACSVLLAGPIDRSSSVLLTAVDGGGEEMAFEWLFNSSSSFSTSSRGHIIISARLTRGAVANSAWLMLSRSPNESVHWKIRYTSHHLLAFRCYRLAAAAAGTCIGTYSLDIIADAASPPPLKIQVNPSIWLILNAPTRKYEILILIVQFVPLSQFLPLHVNDNEDESEWNGQQRTCICGNAAPLVEGRRCRVCDSGRRSRSRGYVQERAVQRQRFTWLDVGAARGSICSAPTNCPGWSSGDHHRRCGAPSPEAGFEEPHAGRFVAVSSFRHKSGKIIIKVHLMVLDQHCKRSVVVVLLFILALLLRVQRWSEESQFGVNWFGNLCIYIAVAAAATGQPTDCVWDWGDIYHRGRSVGGGRGGVS